MYDYRKKLKWWFKAKVVLRYVILPGLVLCFLGSGYVLYHSDMTEVTAVVTGVTPECYASKTEWPGLSFRHRRSETKQIDCALLGTQIARDLEQQGYKIEKKHQIEFDYVSPANGKPNWGVGVIEASDVAVGDRITIGASTTIASRTAVNW